MEEQPVVRLELPIDSAHRTAIIARESGGELRVSAHAIDESRAISPVVEPFQLEEPLRVTAFLYQLDLGALALEEGTLAPNASGRSIPPSDRTVELEVMGAEAGEWRDVLVSDVDADAHADLVLLGAEGLTIWSVLPDGGRTERTIAVAGGASAAQTFDVDEDGNDDIVVANRDGIFVLFADA